MEKENARRKKVIAKFKKITTKNGTLFPAMGGGIFTPTTRKKVLGIMKQPEPGVSKNQFWEDRRNSVERALIDLRLFVEVAGKNNINQVITQENLKPIVEALLWYPLVAQAEPDLNLARIAQLFVDYGFAYLRGMMGHTRYGIPRSSQRTIEEAIDLSNYLVFQAEAAKEAFKERQEKLAALAANKSKKEENSNE